MFFCPVIPSKAASYVDSAQNSGMPSASFSPCNLDAVGSWYLKDPSGTYCGSGFANGTIYMNLTTYREMSADPYSQFCSNNVTTFEGGIVLVTCPQVAVNWCSLPGGCNSTETSENSTSSPVSTPSVLKSPGNLVFNLGAVYCNGKYFWG